MRHLHIATGPNEYTAIPIKEEFLSNLYGHRIVYDCGDGHDLHLDPDEKWLGLDEVEILVRAIHNSHNTKVPS